MFSHKCMMPVTLFWVLPCSVTVVTLPLFPTVLYSTEGDRCPSISAPTETLSVAGRQSPLITSNLCISISFSMDPCPLFWDFSISFPTMLLFILYNSKQTNIKYYPAIIYFIFFFLVKIPQSSTALAVFTDVSLSTKNNLFIDNHTK